MNRSPLLVLLPLLLTLAGCQKHAAPPPPAPAAIPAVSVPPPIQAPASKVVQLLALGTNTCALEESGEVLCWGSNEAGILHQANLRTTATPTRAIAPGSGIKKIVGSFGHICALSAVGAVGCWGSNYRQQLGLQLANQQQPHFSAESSQVPLPEAATEVAAGSAHNCVIGATGKVYCWGYNVAGQLGDGEMPSNMGYLPTGSGNLTSRWKPASVALPLGQELKAREVVAGNMHTCALSGEGRVFCWGSDTQHQLSTNQAMHSASGGGSRVPVAVENLPALPVEHLASGTNHVCALVSDGMVYCWGTIGAQMSELQMPTPQPIRGLPGSASAIAAGGGTSCALVSGKAYCWGASVVGGGVGLPNLTPAPVLDLPGGIQQITVSATHACALTQSSEVYCWGSSGYGVLGPSARRDSLQALRVPAL